MVDRRRLEVIDDCFLRWREEFYIRRVEKERVSVWKKDREEHMKTRVYDEIKNNIWYRRRARETEEIAKTLYSQRYSEAVFSAWRQWQVKE